MIPRIGSGGPAGTLDQVAIDLRTVRRPSRIDLEVFLANEQAMEGMMEVMSEMMIGVRMCGCLLKLDPHPS